MSTLQVDNITNAAGTGSPTFTFGFVNSSPIVASAHETTAHSTSASQPVNFDTVDFDPYSMITTGSSWHVTIPITGTYYINCSLQIGAVDSVLFFVNGSAVRQLTYTSGNVGDGGSTLWKFTAGDLLDIRTASAQTTTGSVATCYFSIGKL